MEPEKAPEKSSCKGSVMSRIEGGEVCPRSKRFFQTRECAVWALWAISVVVGALSVAVTLFVFTHRQYALYEATHDNLFTFMVEVLPFLWIIVFALMIGVGVYELRHTKRGYRYPMWQIITSSMVLSLAGGATLQLFGLGYTTDHVLGERMGMYDSQEKIEKRLWQDPNNGRLVGIAEESLVPPATMISFKDVEGGLWQVSIKDLESMELALLGEKQPVRMLGTVTDEKERLFHTCAVFPLKAPSELSMRDMREDREKFIKKMHGLEDRLERRGERVLKGSREENKFEEPCEKLPVLNIIQ
jgi:hypothetical protein